MKNILREVFTTLRKFCVIVTESKLYQTLNYCSKSTKTNRSAKVLSGKFIESSMASQMHSKYALQTCFNESKLWKQLYIKLTVEFIFVP